MLFGVLGPLEVLDEHGSQLKLGGPRQRAVLAALLVCPGRPVPTEAVAEAVWSENQPDRPRRAVQTAIARLRSLLGPGRIDSVNGQYVARVEPEEVDAALLERAALGGVCVADALALWRGEPFPELPDWVPARSSAARLTELRGTVAAAHIESQIAGGRCDLAAASSRQLIGENPFDERPWLGLIRALSLGGRQVEAVTACREARRLLAEERGLEVSDTLRSLEADVLCQRVEHTVASV